MQTGNDPSFLRVQKIWGEQLLRSSSLWSVAEATGTILKTPCIKMTCQLFHIQGIWYEDLLTSSARWSLTKASGSILRQHAAKGLITVPCPVNIWWTLTDDPWQKQQVQSLDIMLPKVSSLFHVQWISGEHPLMIDSRSNRFDPQETM